MLEAISASDGLSVMLADMNNIAENNSCFCLDDTGRDLSIISHSISKKIAVALYVPKLAVIARSEHAVDKRIAFIKVLDSAVRIFSRNAA